jgi:ribonuclease M5
VNSYSLFTKKNGVDLLIKEVIVVEGRDDITAVKSAVDAEVIATGGFGYKKEFIKNLKNIAEKTGIIILTDPDYAGEQIRKDLSKHLKNCKHAFLPQGKALKKGDIGVENATKEDILEAILKARPSNVERKEEFTKEEIIALGLAGGEGSREKRERLGNILGIGYSNSKQLLNRLNNFGITREEFEKALERIEKENGR